MRPRMLRRMTWSTRSLPKSMTTRTTRNPLNRATNMTLIPKSAQTASRRCGGHFSLSRRRHPANSRTTNFGRNWPMSTKRCYYETLEVERSADDSKLKSAFRKLAMKWHPDKNPGDATSEVRFKKINDAYEVLKDGDKRAAYARHGHAAFEQGGGGGPGFGAGFASSFSDIFEDLFGMAGQRGRGGGRERGADLRYNMEITLEEAFLGKTAQIEIPVSVPCESCSGTGAKVGTKPKACSLCGGQERGRQAQGFFTLERTCPGCQ